MKTVLIINSYGGIGGAGQSLLDIIDSMDKEKFCPIIYCPSTPTMMSEILKSKGIQVVTAAKPLPMYAHYSGASLTKLNFLFWSRTCAIFIYGISELKKLVNKVNPDYVVVNSMTYAWVGPFISNDITKICFHRETYMNTLLNFRTNILKHLLVKYFDKVVFISEFDMKNTTRLKEKQGTVIKDSIKISDDIYSLHDAKESMNLCPTDKHILFTGGFNRIKGGDILVKAMSKIGDRKIKVLFLPVNMTVSSKLLFLKSILGLNYERKIMKMIKKYHLEDRIIMYPPQKEMDSFYKAADLVVFPSKYPHQARPVFEAGVMKKTIIMSRYVETNENVKDFYNGLYFKANDLDEFVKCIYRILNDKALRRKLEENNYTETVANHNLVDFKYKIDAVLNEFYEK